jgi:hypothetical protein
MATVAVFDTAGSTTDVASSVTESPADKFVGATNVVEIFELFCSVPQPDPEQVVFVVGIDHTTPELVASPPTAAVSRIGWPSSRPLTLAGVMLTVTALAAELPQLPSSTGATHTNAIAKIALHALTPDFRLRSISLRLFKLAPLQASASRILISPLL